LEGKKFRFSKKIVNALMREVEDMAELVEPKEKIAAVPDDPQDNRVLECAIEAGSDIIISGDSHLLALQSLGKIKTMNPDEFLRRTRKRPLR